MAISKKSIDGLLDEMNKKQETICMQNKVIQHLLNTIDCIHAEDIKEAEHQLSEAFELMQEVHNQ